MAENPPTTLDSTDLPGFTTLVAQPWIGGVQLNKPVTDITPQEAARLSNLVHAGGDLSVRPGLTQHIFSPAGGAITSIRRLTDPQNGLTRVFFGAGTAWYRSDDGGNPETLESGFSGDPLTFVPIRKPQVSGSWMLVADRLKMRKAGLATTPSRPLGLAAPGVAATNALGTRYTLAVAAFDSSDSTQAAQWTGVAGYDDPGTAKGGVPTFTDVAGVSGSAVAMALTPGGAATNKGYRGLGILQKAMDLSTLTGGPAVSDDDLLHLQLRLSDPTNIQEVRLYFVCSPLSKTGSIPGTSETENVAAYMHAFQPSDYESFISVQESGSNAGSRAAGSSVIGAIQLGRGQIRRSDDDLPDRAIPRTGQPFSQNTGGVGTWLEFSRIGLPLRRGDFIAIGTAGKAGTDWSTVTGLYIVVWTRTNRGVTVSFDDCYFMGGAGPDSSEPGAQKYDYRYIHHDTQTGARSNGSPTQLQSAWIDSLRQAIVVTPQPAGNANMRQEFYRRGGAVTDNWYFVGENSSDGGPFTDTLTDAATVASDTLPTENFQPVPTVNGGGTTVLAQPVPILFGPIADGVYCALGDPYRAGHVYSCLAGNFDAWPSTGEYIVEVCSPTEELMNGCVLAGGGFVLSRERGYRIYANPGGVGILYSPTGVTPGLAARWGFCTGMGSAFYVARDGVRATNGEDSQLLSDAIRPLFNGLTVADRHPIDFSHPTAIRLAYHNGDLWFSYTDIAGATQKAVYSLLYRYWRFVDFATAVSGAMYSDETENVNSLSGDNRLLLGTTAGVIARHEGYSDLGLPIPFTLRTGAWTFGSARSDKLLGDLVVDADQQNVPIVVRTLFNAETVLSGNVVIPATTGRLFTPIQPFGPEPERARSLSIDITGTASIHGRPVLYGVGAAVAEQPEVTLERVTQWEPLPGAEAYLRGLRLDCDTFGVAKSILVEAELNGVITPVTTLSVQTTQGTGPSTRHTLWFSWPAVHANTVRLRPLDDARWTLWRADWLSQAEPERIAVWDTNWENPGGGDRYYTGLDLECDTFGQPKTLQVYVDQTLIGTYTVTANGRSYRHITLPTGRGHLFRFVATDANPGLLYGHEWLTTEEPREQANWNAGYTVWSSLSDKYLKGLVIEADTFSQIKTINVEVDGVVAYTFSAIHGGRSVQNYSFPQILGRVFRVIPADANPSRLYGVLPIFDEEPYALSRWETQLLDFGFPASGWGSVVSADICYRSTTPTTLTLTVYNAAGTLMATLTETLGSTGGAKRKVYVPFTANKGVLYKFVFQTDGNTPVLTLYQEESRVRVQPWGGVETHLKPFGNSDLDQTRNMVSAVAAAARSGGGS